MNMLAIEECAHSDRSRVERLIAVPNVKKKKKKKNMPVTNWKEVCCARIMPNSECIFL